MAVELHTIDLMFLGKPEAIAAYVIRTADACALIECGPATCVNNCIAALAERGVKPTDIEHVILTHIHLDHAGGAWRWAQLGATIHVHEFGAKHLIDPEKLISSATRIYGAQMDTLWGAIKPCPAELVQPVRDGDVIDLGEVALRAIETPGHARHHHAFATEVNGERICFAGDVAAMIVPGRDYICIPMPPPEFNLQQWQQSIDRLLAQDFDAIYPTHFDRIDDWRKHLHTLRRELGEHAEFVRQRLERGDSMEAILADYTRWQRAAAQAKNLNDEQMQHLVSDNLLRMNVQGVTRYWRKQEEHAA